MSESDDCLFCKIIAGQIPSSKVYEDETTYAFNDINPKAKVHVLVVPKKHYANVAELAAGDPTELAHIVSIAEHRRQGISRRLPTGVQHRSRRRPDRLPRARARDDRRKARRVVRGISASWQRLHVPSPSRPNLTPVAVLGPVDEVIREVSAPFRT